MKAKAKAYVKKKKKEQIKSTNKKNKAVEPTIQEQLGCFAAIIVDIYFETLNTIQENEQK